MIVKYYTTVVCGRCRGDCEPLVLWFVGGVGVIVNHYTAVVCGRCRGDCEPLQCCGLWEV